MPAINVKGGTNAGWRKLSEAKGPWTCSCGHENQSYHVTCFGCNSPRPSAT